MAPDELEKVVSSFAGIKWPTIRNKIGYVVATLSRDHGAQMKSTVSRKSWPACRNGDACGRQGCSFTHPRDTRT